MKKLISIIAAAALTTASAATVFAADKAAGTPDVFVNGAEIFFDDQPAQIVDNFTLVPARGVFEAMGAKVSWDEEKQQVEVESADHNTIVRLIIGDSTMKVYDVSGLFGALLSGQDFKAPETPVTLEVPPQIMNDRTMIPLRAISEAIDADVQWDGEAYAVNITSADAPKNESAESKPGYTLSASADTVNEGETVDVFVNVANLPENTYVGGVAAAVEYNKENFEFVDANLVGADGESKVGICRSNDNYSDKLVRVMGITIDSETGVKADGKVMKLTFKSINGKESAFTLVNGYTSDNGLMTYVQFNTLEAETKSKLYQGNEFYVDTTPVVINAGK